MWPLIVVALGAWGVKKAGEAIHHLLFLELVRRWAKDPLFLFGNNDHDRE